MRQKKKQDAAAHITYRSKTEDTGSGFIKSKVLMDNDVVMVMIKHTTYMSV